MRTSCFPASLVASHTHTRTHARVTEAERERETGDLEAELLTETQRQRERERFSLQRRHKPLGSDFMTTVSEGERKRGAGTTSNRRPCLVLLLLSAATAAAGGEGNQISQLVFPSSSLCERCLPACVGGDSMSMRMRERERGATGSPLGSLGRSCRPTFSTRRSLPVS